MNPVKVFVDDLYRAWLGVTAAASCCVPQLAGQQEDDLGCGEKHRYTNRVQSEQPAMIVAPRQDPHQRFDSRSSYSSSTMLSRRRMRSQSQPRSLASFVSSHVRPSTRVRSQTNELCRPTISGPSDFRRVEGQIGRRREDYRPLELSIHLPENRLDPLPDFSPACEEAPRILQYPARAHVLSKSISVMSFASSTFTIPRKPVGSILDCRVSEEKGRQSIDFWSSPSTAQSEWVAQPLLPRPRDSMAGSVYEKPLPVLPLRVRSYTTPVRTLYRRSSEMSLRTRGEDESLYLDGRIREIDTIEEEKAKSPVELGLDYDAREQIPPRQSSDRWPTRLSFTRTPARSSTCPHLSSRLTTVEAMPSTPCLPQRTDSQAATVPFRSVRPALAMVQPGPLNIRKRSLSRVSKWLFSFGTDRAPSPPEQMSPPPPTTFYQCPAAGPVQSSSTIATLTSATTLEGPPSLATVAAGSGESTPASALVGGRATLIRQHTFGLGHGKAPRKSEDVVRVFQSGPEYREVDSTSIGLPLASPVGMAF